AAASRGTKHRPNRPYRPEDTRSVAAATASGNQECRSRADRDGRIERHDTPGFGIAPRRLGLSRPQRRRWPFFLLVERQLHALAATLAAIEVCRPRRDAPVRA